MSEVMDAQIRQVLAAQARLVVDVETLDEDDDLYHLGMTSHANVNVMFALEDAFDIEFPEEMLLRATFESVAAIRRSITFLLDEQLTA